MALSDALRKALYFVGIGPAIGAELADAIDANTTAVATNTSNIAAIKPQSASPLIANGLGYIAGAGGAVTQATSRATGVTLNKPAGQITTDTSSLAAEANADFVVTNSQVRIGDVIVLSIQSGTNGGNTEVTVVTVAAGSFTIQVSNNNASGGTAETGAIIINYAVISSVAA